jgi:hypothetical protein
MNTILSMLLPAVVASGAAAAALALSRGAPPRLRLGIAAVGLLSWVIPWSLLILPFSAPTSLALNWTGAIAAGIAHAVPARAAQGPVLWPLAPMQAATPIAWLPGTLLSLAVIPGLLMFGIDVIRHRRTLGQWRRASVSAEQLRGSLPDSVRKIPHGIRIVSGSRVAAATGLLRGTIWVGDGLASHSDLNAALLHECLHIARRDAVWILAVTFLKRLYWWNPIVRHFTHQAGFLIEAACDENCAQLYGRREYRNSLARLILDSHRAATLAFASMIGTGRQEVARVAALGRVPRMHFRLWIGVGLCATGLAAAAIVNAQSAADPRIGSWDEVKNPIHYDSLLRVFKYLDNGMIHMDVNAKLREVNRWHVDFKCDGGRYRTLTYDGKFVGITYSCRQTGARRIDSAFTREEAEAGVELGSIQTDWTSSAWTEEVSADGMKYRTNGVTRLTNGQVRYDHRDFVRRN